MPHVDGVEAIAQIKAAWPEAAIVVLTTYDTDEAIVKTHLLHVYDKLGVTDRAAAVAHAYESGILSRRHG